MVGHPEDPDNLLMTLVPDDTQVSGGLGQHVGPGAISLGSCGVGWDRPKIDTFY